MFNLDEVETIYIGGGNPAISINNINKISKIINSNVKSNNIKEFTIESNPVNINKKLIKTLKKINCNRVSVGIQSFNKKVLIYCNRKKQDLNTINEALKLLNENNFNISIDLINGLPFTEYQIEIDNLDQVMKKYANIKHISFYGLSIEKGSYFYKLNNIKYAGNNEVKSYEKEFIKLIKKKGFKRYEVSNYAKNKNYSLHNLNYWKYKNYLGLGPSAHSKVDKLKIENKPEINKYINNKDYKIEYKLTEKELIKEYILMGFRLMAGINIEDFYQMFNVSIKELLGKNMEKYILQKMIKINKNNIMITSRGMNILNRILVDFFVELDLYFSRKGNN